MKSASVAAAVCLVLLCAAWVRYHPLFGKPLKSTAYSESVRAAAVAFRKTGLNPARIHYLEVPTTFQFYLETASRRKCPAAILSDPSHRDNGILVATRGALPDRAAFGMATVHEVFRWPPDQKEPPVVRIFDLSW